MKWVWMLSVALLPIALPCPAAAETGAVTLRWNPQVGEPLRAEIVFIGSEQVDQFQYSYEVGLISRWQLQRITEKDQLDWQITIERVQVSLQAPHLGMVRFDSQSSSPPPSGLATRMAATLKPLVHTTLQATMNRQGRWESVSLPEPVLAELKAIAGGDTLLTPEAIRTMWQQAWPPLPDQAVGPGSQWQTSAQVSSPLGRLTRTTEWSFAGEREASPTNPAQLTFDYTFTWQDAAPRPVSIALQDQENQGQLLFDLEQGRLQRSESRQHLLLQLNREGQTTQRHIRQTVTVTLVPILPPAETDATSPPAAADDRPAATAEQ